MGVQIYIYITMVLKKFWKPILGVTSVPSASLFRFAIWWVVIRNGKLSSSVADSQIYMTMVVPKNFPNNKEFQICNHGSQKSKNQFWLLVMVLFWPSPSLGLKFEPMLVVIRTGNW